MENRVIFDRFLQTVREKFGAELQHYVIADEQSCIFHAWKRPDPQIVLKESNLTNGDNFAQLIPDFHLFAHCPQEHAEKIQLTLTTDSGQVAIKQDIDDLNGDIYFESDSCLINQFLSNSLRLCAGLALDKYTNKSCHQGLAGNVRSKDCSYAVFDGNSMCKSCQDFREPTSKPKSKRTRHKIDEFTDYLEEIKDEPYEDTEEDDDYLPEIDVKAELEDVKIENDVLDLLEINRDLKQCPKCNKQYTFAKSVRKHVLKCDGVFRERKPKKPKVIKKERSADTGQRECPICLTEHKRFSTYEAHLSIHKEKIDINMEVACPECNEAVKKGELNEHFRQFHDGEGVCCECLKMFREKVALKYHFSRHHKYEHNVLCTECGRGFKFQHQLKVHFAEHHDKGGASTVVCDQCGKTFYHRKRLVSHIRTAHSRSQTFPCNLCEKVFYQAYKLNKHLAIHSGSKPWRCNHCAYRSVRKDNVLLHCRKVHHLADANSTRDVAKLDENGAPLQADNTMLN